MAKTRTPPPKPRNTVYTGLLAISLLVMMSVAGVLYYDLDQLGTPPKDKLRIDVPGATGKAGAPK